MYALRYILLALAYYGSKADASSTSSSSSSSAKSKTKNPIEHLIILMMENRSFDHYLGWLMADQNAKIDGLTGDEFNCVRPGDTNSECVTVGKNGFDTGPDDPGHTFDATTDEIYGFHKPVDASAVPVMNGFVRNARELRHDLTNPMEMFTIQNDSAPVLNVLGLEYCIFDRWFCSVPGPTDPNRAFAMAGTTDGVVTNFNGTLWTQQSYFDFLREHGVSFGTYYDATTWAIGYLADMNKLPNSEFVYPIAQFYEHLKGDDLASFVWLQPSLVSSSEGPPNWQHPDASVALGEQLIQTVYENLRDSRYWNSSALVITYDEHGGFFDHVPPPEGVPPPDDIIASNGFKFDRLGVRIPTVLVSPWVDSGCVISEPQFSDGQWEGTSNIATANNLFGINDTLGARQAWAATYDYLFLDRKTPRSDAPRFEPVKGWTQELLDKQGRKPVEINLQNEVKHLCTQVLGIPVEDCPQFATHAEASRYCLGLMPRYIQKIQNAG